MGTILEMLSLPVWRHLTLALLHATWQGFAARDCAAGNFVEVHSVDRLGAKPVTVEVDVGRRRSEGQ
jgi:hypothetical protein